MVIWPYMGVRDAGTTRKFFAHASYCGMHPLVGEEARLLFFLEVDVEEMIDGLLRSTPSHGLVIFGELVRRQV